LVSEEQSHWVIASFELAKGREGGAARASAHNAITLGIVAAKIALDGSQDLRVVVDSKENWFWHIPQMMWGGDSLQLSRQAQSSGGFG
jgi:hypothetical protein